MDATAGTVQLRWSEIVLPGGVAADNSGSTTPQAVVTSEDGSAWLLGTATDAPEHAPLDAGATTPTSWYFTAPGDYSLTATATLVDTEGTVVGESAPTTMLFRVTDPLPHAPAPAPEPEPQTNTDPEAGAEAEVTPDADGAGEQDTPALGDADVKDDAEDIPEPEGQSDQPAPPSQEKTIVGAVHTDAVSAYVDNGTLVLQSKADMDVDGDGQIDLGSRLETRRLLFHVNDKAKQTFPGGPGYEFLGAPGSTIWMAPQTQDHDIIWPGFSTEDPSLRAAVDPNARLTVTLDTVTGPGDVEVVQNGPSRVFSSKDQLTPWTLGVPQHTHMNWVFTKAGTYTLTFSMTGKVDGRQQTATNDYVFVVGDLDAHTQSSSVTLRSSTKDLDAGEAILLTSEVSPADAVGAVQFRDEKSNSILGHTPVKDGKAEFRTDSLTPGGHRIVAEFIPTWKDDVTASQSTPVTLTVAGEDTPKPEHDDTIPVDDTELAGVKPATSVKVT
ncbi:MAG: choice-of-anchor M domain-containing protein, partial [Actinomycetia bacterium]|nr:choice-of-anchor M domain-containing protein [Actinomycetes bacterium]